MAAPVTFVAGLDGNVEVPVNNLASDGWARVTFDITAHTMRVEVHFEDLSSPNTAAHIHCCTANPFDALLTAPVATVTPTFTGFPSGTSGDYDHTFDMSLNSSYRAGFITANGGTAASAEAALFAGLLAGKAYLNVHSQTVPGGEIRGFLSVPEPGSLLLVVGAMGLLGLRRRLA